MVNLLENALKRTAYTIPPECIEAAGAALVGISLVVGLRRLLQKSHNPPSYQPTQELKEIEEIAVLVKGECNRGDFTQRIAPSVNVALPTPHWSIPYIIGIEQAQNRAAANGKQTLRDAHNIPGHKLRFKITKLIDTSR